MFLLPDSDALSLNPRKTNFIRKGIDRMGKRVDLNKNWEMITTMQILATLQIEKSLGEEKTRLEIEGTLVG